MSQKFHHVKWIRQFFAVFQELKIMDSVSLVCSILHAYMPQVLYLFQILDFLAYKGIEPLSLYCQSFSALY